jgi:hypothetical protein
VPGDAGIPDGVLEGGISGPFFTEIHGFGQIFSVWKSVAHWECADESAEVVSVVPLKWNDGLLNDVGSVGITTRNWVFAIKEFEK